VSRFALDRRPNIAVVGGFLGSGKTTLILHAARLLEQRGLRCAVVLNDQGDELVDSKHTEAQGMIAREVTGGCFCCRFSALATVIDDLRRFSPDVVFAEPVGSCTDIAATVLNPLREDFDRYRVAPFTVLVDPARATALLREDADSDLAYLFHKQMQEADLVCITKADLYAAAPVLPCANMRRLSARTGQGVSEWLDEILFGQIQAGTDVLEIDYSRYAQAEAALAWLNLSLILEPRPAISPATVVGPFLDGLDRAMTAAGILTVHMKIFDSTEAGWLKAAQCANGEEPAVEGDLDASPANRHELLLNLRAKGSADQVQRIVEAQLRQLDGTKRGVRIECFSPAPPKPERRIPIARPFHA
jgi:Ni2+-binding GTPase involved in maturation of urease and hydrogenase